MSSKDEEENFAADAIAFVLSTVLAIWGIYTTFIVMGAMLTAVFQERGDLRFALALVLALIIPIMTAMGANSRKEGAEGIQRLTRVAIGATILSAGCAAIVALTMANKVVPALEAEPNWFLDNPDATQGTPALNRRYSGIIAGMSCRVAHEAGFYYCPPHIGK